MNIKLKIMKIRTVMSVFYWIVPSNMYGIRNVLLYLRILKIRIIRIVSMASVKTANFVMYFL